MSDFNPLLDLPAFPTDRYAPLADRFKALLHTQADVIFVQAEAILALEAAATSLGRPGLVAVNVVTSPYGGLFGGWLRRAGAIVHEVKAVPGRPITAAAVAGALEALPRVDLVAMVHAETSSGICNPLAEIAGMVRAQGALLVVDSVAAVGGHPLDVDGLGIDVCVIGPQKALGGPAGVSVASVSERAWATMAENNPAVPSILSLSDIKANWLDRGRGVLPGMPSALEFRALDAAMDRVAAETLAGLIARHQRAAGAARAGLAAMGAELWVAEESEASMLITAAVVPAGLTARAIVEAAAAFGVTLTPGVGEIADRLVRLDHTGRHANFRDVLAAVTAYGAALHAFGVDCNVPTGAEAVSDAYAGAASG